MMMVLSVMKNNNLSHEYAVNSATTTIYAKQYG